MQINLFNFDSNKKGPSWIKISCFREGQILFCKKKKINTPILHDWNSLKLISLSGNLFVMLWRCFATKVGIYIDAYIRRVRRCQRGYQNTQSEEGQTTQWSKEKVQKDKQQSTKHYTQNWQTTIYKTLHTKLTNNNLQNITHKTDK